MRTLLISTTAVLLAGFVAGCGNANSTTSQQFQKLQITSFPPDGSVQVAYGPNGAGFTFAASGGVAPYKWSWAPFYKSRAVPPGLSLSTAGLMAGTPTVAGTFYFIVTVTDSASPPQQDGSNYSITVAGTPLESPPSGTVGQTYGGTVSIYENHCAATFTGWSPKLGAQWSWAAAPGSSLPPGLGIGIESYTCGGSTRCCVTVTSPPLLSGVPTAAGTYNINVTAGGSNANYTITIAAATGATAAAKEVSAPRQVSAASHHHYKIVDMGTFGGPSSNLALSNGVTSPGAVNQVLNNRGTIVGWGDTSTLDPYAPNCYSPFNQDCYLPVAFKWQKGALTDLGVLPGGDASNAVWISDSGLIAGQARNGLVDPLLPGVAEVRAVLWKDGDAIDLGTLGGNESSAFSVNNRGQVVGLAVNTVPDPFSFYATQLRAFLWQDGEMQDLGTLGGPEAWALFVNEPGQVAGFSLTSTTPNSATDSCGTGIPTTDPFLWEDGHMIDLGTLGGTCGFPFSLNNRGQVVGLSDLAGDLTNHPFLWQGGKMKDLGTLGGTFGFAAGINDAGEVVGAATDEDDQSLLAFLWKQGNMTNLGTVNGYDCSSASHINSKGQIVGSSFLCASGPDGPAHGFLWQDGFMTDLNTFVSPDSGLTLSDAGFINDLGEIAAAGVLSDGDTRALLLIPCDENHPNIEGCDYSQVEENPIATGEGRETVKSSLTPETIRRQVLASSLRSPLWPRRLGLQNQK
jgi:probable HAF family extracellular repeat protein